VLYIFFKNYLCVLLSFEGMCVTKKIHIYHKIKYKKPYLCVKKDMSLYVEQKLSKKNTSLQNAVKKKKKIEK